MLEGKGYVQDQMSLATFTKGPSVQIKFNDSNSSSNVQNKSNSHKTSINSPSYHLTLAVSFAREARGEILARFPHFALLLYSYKQINIDET